jgi:hypothetical protein
VPFAWRARRERRGGGPDGARREGPSRDGARALVDSCGWFALRFVWACGVGWGGGKRKEKVGAGAAGHGCGFERDECFL